MRRMKSRQHPLVAISQHCGRHAATMTVGGGFRGNDATRPTLDADPTSERILTLRRLDRDPASLRELINTGLAAEPAVA